MKHTLTIISLALATAMINAEAAGTDPFDFDYEIAGKRRLGDLTSNLWRLN